MKKIYKLGGRLMQKNNKEEFNVIFRGDIEYIDSEILLANLLTTTEIIQEINKELEGKEIEIYIKPFAPGSFEISYILAHVGFVSGLFNVISGTNISGLKFILNIFRDILNLKKLLGGKKPQEIIQHENKVEIKSAQGNTITVIDKSLNIYMNNVHIESAINKGFKNLEKNEAITDYVIEEKDGKVLFDVNREQYKNLYSPNEYLEENKKEIEIEKAHLVIFKIVFERGYKWSFIYEGQKINAFITDEDFYENLDKYEFHEGDYFEATLKVIQIFDPKYQAYINEEYEVKKIIKHHKMPKQQPIRFN